MCTAFWNLDLEFTCPTCAERSNWNLQTHYRGQAGSSVLHYLLGELVEELAGVTAQLSGGTGPFEEESFIGTCRHCRRSFDFGADIRNGAVVDVFLLARENA